MLFLLSPAKSLDYDTPVPEGLRATTPQFVQESQRLIEVLRHKSLQDIASLMSISDKLAALNLARYQAWSPRFSTRNSRQAVLAFDGEVYRGLAAGTLSADELEWAQSRLVILSGLYGVLRPLDRLQPYRLEMGTRLATGAGPDLYRFWGRLIADHIDRQLHADRTPVVVNLASREYFRAVDTDALKARVVECVFQEGGSAGHRVVGVHAKRARGLMARYAIRHRLRTPEQLRDFDLEGYAFDARESSPDRLVFRRPATA